MNPINFTPEVIATIVGLILTLLFSYFPSLNTWFAALKSEVKSWIMIGLLVMTALIITLLAMYGVIPTVAPITWLDFGKVVLAMLIANQALYKISPETAAVREAKLDRKA